VYLSFIDPPEANISNGIYTVQSANLTHYRVPAANNGIIFNANANGVVHTWNPIMTFLAVGHGMRVADRVHLIFANNDTQLGNGEYYIKTTGTNLFTVEHPNVAFIHSVTGNVNVYTEKVSINSVGDHGFNFHDDLYIRFTSGDTANAVNGYYNIKAVPDSETATIFVPNILMTNTAAVLHTKQSIYTDTNHGLTDMDNVNVVYAASEFDGIYPVEFVNANAFMLTTNRPMISNGTANVYQSIIEYDTATIYRENHGFETGNTIYTFFDSEIVNTFYTVTNVENANTFNVAGISANVSTNINMVGNVEIGLYK
jgi:hypothetical protein